MTRKKEPFVQTEERKAASRARGAQKIKDAHFYLIEGESVSLTEIGERLGITRSVATARHRGATTPVTWEKLRCPKSSRRRPSGEG